MKETCRFAETEFHVKID